MMGKGKESEDPREGEGEGEEKPEELDPFQHATTIRIELSPRDIENLTVSKPHSCPPTQRLKRPSRLVLAPKRDLVQDLSAPPAGEEENPFQQTTTMRIDLSPAGEKRMRAQQVAVPSAPKSVPQPAGPGAIGGRDFQELLENIYDGCLITDRKGQIVSANARAVHYFGYDRQAFCKRNVVDIISGANKALLTTIRDTLANDQFVLIQAICIRDDGSMFPAEISVNSLDLLNESHLNFFIRDITLRKETEERLKTGYNAIQNSGDGIAMADTDGNLGDCNPAALVLLGYEVADDVRGVNMREFLVREVMADEIWECVNEKRETWQGEIALKRSDDSTFFARLSVAPNLNFDGNLIGMVLSFTDVTEQKVAQQQLERYAQELSERNQQMGNDLDMARDIQQAFLPREYPVFPRSATPETSAVRFNHLYIPSSAVGGDFLDLVTVSNTHAGLFISDVVGHGMRAALVTATLRGLIEQLKSVAHDPGTFMTELNRTYTSIFGEQQGEILFATAFYAVFDIITGRMRYTNAGHPPPLVLRRDAKRAETLALSKAAMGAGIGLFAGSQYASDECQLALGDVLLLYTDGLTEAADASGDSYDSERLRREFENRAELPPGRILQELVGEVRRFAGRDDFDDDVCVLTMQVARLGANHRA